jgi:transposase
MSKRAMGKQRAQVRSRKAQQRKVVAKAKAQKIVTLPVIRPDTAGIDIGSMEIFVAVSPHRDAEPVRSFGTFTSDLEAIADWLQACEVRSVAMESTGVYWIPLYQILVDRKLEVCLVNARHFHNVPGRKTDVCDCQWLQYLHAVGLLRGSFRPEQTICAMRTLLRHRQNLVEMAAEHVLHMQKAMEQMNVKLTHVISDITGVTGMRIIDAILEGQRDARALAKLRDKRIQADEETIVKSLEGDYRPEHLITLEQSVAGYRFYQKQMTELDQKMEGFMEALPAKIDLREHPLPASTKRQKRQHNAPDYDLRSHCYRAFGVDLTEIPGFAAPTAQVMLVEVGPDLTKFPSASAFAKWLTLSPNNDITGGKVQSARTSKGKSRAALALRQAAQTVEHSENHLGQFFRRMRAKLGRAEAITAVAHKMARIFFTLVRNGCAYDESALAKADVHQRARQEAKLRRHAREIGFQLVPMEVTPV